MQPSARPTPHSLQRPPPPVCPHPTLLTPRSYLLCAPPVPLTPCSRSTTRARPPAPSGAPLVSLMLVVPSRASYRSPPSQGHPRVWPVLVVLARYHSAPAPTQRPESIGPGLSLSPYVINVCSSVSGVIIGILQVFHMDVAYVVSISEACCKHLFKMFQLFQSYAAISVFMLQVASVLSRCCIYFTYMLPMYVSNVLFASDVCERY
jgi:hypothetical protein